jgi:uncharacterized protein YeaO (DUF488 family)
MTIKLKRIYEYPSTDDGYRILVDRLWPRGLKKEDAKIDLWLKDIAPSTILRTWFSHDPTKWSDFKKKYTLELEKNIDLLDNIRKLHQEKTTLTLLYATGDQQHNNAVILQKVLKQK